MSTATALIEEAAQHKCTLIPNCDRLKLDAPAQPPADFLERLKAHKPEVLAALAEQQIVPIDRWHAGVEHMTECDMPTGVTLHEWRSLIDACVFFLDGWSERAERLGWDDIALFGVNPERPFKRRGNHGLVPQLPGKHLAAMTRETAVIKAGRKTITFHRPGPDEQKGMVPLWAL